MNTAVNKNRFSEGEELANALSHLIGALLSIAAMILMVVASAKRGTGWHMAASLVFGLSMIFLYFSSAVTHWLPLGKLKNSFFTLDQISIFLLIAGTYTPLSLVTLHGTSGWIVFSLEWGLALTGIIRLLSRKNIYTSGVGLFDIMIYVIMGWLVLPFAGPVLERMPAMGFIWILIGGLFYTTGIIFYKVTKFSYHHLIWHLMVIGGTFSHFIAIYFYILP